MAPWTSLAAASMLRSRSNWMVTAVEPSALVDVIWDTPGIWAICRSSGWATEEAIVSGDAPGRLALTVIVGKSIGGSGSTRRSGVATMPADKIATTISGVAMGRPKKAPGNATL